MQLPLAPQISWRIHSNTPTRAQGDTKSSIRPERRTETLESSASAYQYRGKAVFSLKTTNFISIKPACNLLLQLSKQLCSTSTLAQLWQPTGLICVLPLTRPASIPFFDVYSFPRMAPWLLKAWSWPWFLLVLFYSDALSPHQQSEDNTACLAISAAGLKPDCLMGRYRSQRAWLHCRDSNAGSTSVCPPLLLPTVSMSSSKFTNSLKLSVFTSEQWMTETSEIAQQLTAPLEDQNSLPSTHHVE